MAQYAILIYDKELPGGVADMPQEILDGHMAVPEKIEKIGAKIVNAQATQPTSTATTIRKGGVITDGPFIESKEALAGFFVIEAENLDQAIAVGKCVPVMEGGIEVRPLIQE
ncbi:YciI family protein [Salinispora mooreana]|uniref:YciI family protein n=1 Tax=Salinispora mooreana TaxID=999545 RepID=UPI00035CC549|nr:YciI family protein [Salinispora mooreana]